MTHLEFSASQCKTLLSQLQCSNESRNAHEAKLMNLAICQQEGRPVLVGSTRQPSFDMELCLPLATAEDVKNNDIKVNVETCQDRMWRVETQHLVRSLAAFGQNSIVMTLQPDGVILLSGGSMELKVQAACIASDNEPLPVQTTAGVRLPWLTRALNIAVCQAEQPGNALEMRGVHLHVAPTYAVVEGMSTDATVIVRSAEEALAQAPTEEVDVVLSVDAVKHMLAALAIVPKNTDIVTLDATDRRDGVVTFRCGGMTIQADHQAVSFPCLDGLDEAEVDEADGQLLRFEKVLTLRRLELLDALRKLKALGEQVVYMFGHDRGAIALTGTSNKHADTMLTVVDMDLHSTDTMPDRTLRIAPLLPLIATLDYGTRDVDVWQNASGRLKFVAKEAEVIL